MGSILYYFSIEAEKKRNRALNVRTSDVVVVAAAAAATVVAAATAPRLGNVRSISQDLRETKIVM